MTATEIALAASVALMLLGAIGATFVKDVTRLVLSLGLFLLGVAAAFLSLASALLAVSQIFVYVGGVLVLVLFALMMVRRGGTEAPRVESRHDIAAAATALGVFLILMLVPGPIEGVTLGEVAVDPGAVADALLGPDLVAFELTGVLLLVALLAVIVIVKGAKDS